jgi:hypothetical protein
MSESLLTLLILVGYRFIEYLHVRIRELETVLGTTTASAAVTSDHAEPGAVSTSWTGLDTCEGYHLSQLCPGKEAVETLLTFETQIDLFWARPEIYRI